MASWKSAGSCASIFQNLRETQLADDLDELVAPVNFTRLIGKHPHLSLSFFLVLIFVIPFFNENAKPCLVSIASIWPFILWQRITKEFSMEFFKASGNRPRPGARRVFSAVTYLGDELAFMALALLLFWCVDKRTGYYVFVVGLFRNARQTSFYKILCRVPRPWVLDPRLYDRRIPRAPRRGYSFPSGHAERRRGRSGPSAFWQSADG